MIEMRWIMWQGSYERTLQFRQQMYFAGGSTYEYKFKVAGKTFRASKFVTAEDAKLAYNNKRKEMGLPCQ